MTDDFFHKAIQAIKTSRKYRSLNLPDEMLLDILQKEVATHNRPKDIEVAFRGKVHNIVAPYLDNVNYAQEMINIQDAFEDNDPQIIRAYCLHILTQHASTKERIPSLGSFYKTLFDIVGQPTSILDLACGLNPFSLPWMGLDRSVAYYAYDIHKPRIDLINRFFTLSNRPALAFHQDILVSPPQEKADLAFFFKEAHRFEKREPGCNRQFWHSLKVSTLLVSLPTSDLKHHHDLIPRHRQLVEHALKGEVWPITEVIIDDEIVFIINKHA